MRIKIKSILRICYILIYPRFKLKLVKGHFEREITPSEIDFAPSTPISLSLKYKKN
jgi:hypothetical protein